MSERLIENKYLIFALVFALLNMGAIFLIFGFQQYGDSSDYFETIRWFQGKSEIVFPERILRPLGPILAVPFEFLGEGAGLLVQNIIFYLAVAVLMFKIVDLIFHNKKQALLASLFFVTATPVIESGLSYLTDTGAWFFYLLSIFLTLVYFKNKNRNLIILNGFLSGLAVLMKENGGLGILFFSIMVLLSEEFHFKQKISKIALFGTFFLIPVVISQVLMYQYFHFTFWNWFLMGRENLEDGLLLTILRYFGQLFRVLGVLWPFVLWGLWQELKEKNYERLKIYLALLPSSLSFFLWTTDAGARSVFIFAPLGILLATYALKKRGIFFLPLLILVILLLNYWFCSVNQEIPFIDRIYTSIFSR